MRPLSHRKQNRLSERFKTAIRTR